MLPRSGFDVQTALQRNLEASAPLVRMGAMLSIQACLPPGQAAALFRDRLTREEDPECREMLAHFLGGEVDDHLPADLGTLGGPGWGAGAETRRRQWLQELPRLGPGSVAGFLATLPSGEVGDIIDQSLALDHRPAVLAQLLAYSRQHRPAAEHHSRVQKIVRATTALPLLRLLPILLEGDAELVVPQLPALLRHPSQPVRVLTVRTIYRLFPEEAVRLVGELLASPEEAVRLMAVGLLGTFPLSHMQGPLLSALEEGRIPPSGAPIVLELVRNNPEPSLLAGLAELYCRRGGEIPTLWPLLKTLAESIVMVRREVGTPGMVLGRALETARQRLTGLLTVDIVAEVLTDLSDPSTATPVPLPGSDPSEGGVCSRGGMESTAGGPRVAGSEGGPGGEGQCGLSPSPDGTPLSLPASPTPADLLALFRRFPQGTQPPAGVVSWLVDRLQDEQPRVVSIAIELLGTWAPRLLLPHLPVLSLHADPLVMNQAIRQFRKGDPAGFLRRIGIWISGCGDRTTRRAALIGLAQMPFSQAAPLVWQVLEGATHSELIANFGNILLLNPDRETVMRLRRQARRASSRLRPHFETLAGRVEANLAVIGASGDGFLARVTRLLSPAQVTDLLEEIRSVHLGPEQREGWFDLFGGGRVLAIGLIVILGGIGVWLGLRGWAPGGLRSRDTRGAVPAPSLPQVAGTPFGDAKRRGTLVSYDAKSRIWFFRTPEGETFPVMIPLSAKVREGQSIVLMVRDSGRRLQGVPVSTAVLWEY